MESKEESIDLLKMRMNRHMDLSSGKEVKPENIQYYVASFLQQPENMGAGKGAPKEHLPKDRAGGQTGYGKLQNGESLPKSEDKAPPQKDPRAYQKAKDIERENEEYRQRIKSCRIKEDANRADVQLERAKNEYEKVIHSMDEEELYGFGKPHWLNIKG